MANTEMTIGEVARQSYVFHCLLLPWVLLFDISGLRAGFLQLISIMNSLHASLPI